MITNNQRLMARLVFPEEPTRKKGTSILAI
jgi:hypothetical protein